MVSNDIGIAKTRELVCRDAGKQRFYMIDDDVLIHRRNAKYFGKEPNMDVSKRICTKDDFADGFLFTHFLENSMCCSFSFRFSFCRTRNV